MTEAQENPDGLDLVRADVLAAALMRAPFEGFTNVMLRRATTDAGYERHDLAAAFPRGVADLLTYWSDCADDEMAEVMATPEFQAQRIREKAQGAVRARLDVLGFHKEAARRAAATLALPIYGRLSARLVWRTCDRIWREMGDKSTDYNFYTKRAVLSAVWTTTFARWLSDETPDEARTNAFLEKRIENVMQFEKVKARVLKLGLDPKGPIEALARLRYPARRS